MPDPKQTSPPRGGRDPKALSVLLQISDSALPTGGFSHSFGMEQYLARGQIHDPASFAAWLHAYLRTQLTWTDALLIRLTYQALDRGESPAPLGDLSLVLTMPAQVRNAGVAMAKRLRAIAVEALGIDGYDVEPTHPALEFAVITHRVGIDADTAAHAHLLTAVTTLTQNAVRGIPIGQSAGQAIIAAAHPEIVRAVEAAKSLTIDDLGAVAPGLEIAQMQHERLRARMFMS